MKMLVRYHQMLDSNLYFRLNLSKHKVILKSGDVDETKFNGKEFYGKLMFYSKGLPVYQIETKWK
jgi:hypothetical protein